MNAGVTYFELVRRGPYWEQLKKSGALAIHVAGDFRRVQMELWAVRGL
jgi:type VI secretion system protein ImpJ